MASPASSEVSSQFIPSSHDLDEFDIPEIDVALLKDLLDDSEAKDGDDAKEVECMVHSMDATNEAGEKIEKKENDHVRVHDFGYLDILEMAPLPSEEIMAWNMDDMAVGVDYFCDDEDYSQLFNGVSSDEPTYNLWQDS